MERPLKTRSQYNLNITIFSLANSRKRSLIISHVCFLSNGFLLFRTQKCSKTTLVMICQYFCDLIAQMTITRRHLWRVYCRCCFGAHFCPQIWCFQINAAWIFTKPTSLKQQCVEILVAHLKSCSRTFSNLSWWENCTLADHQTNKEVIKEDHNLLFRERLTNAWTFFSQKMNVKI